MGIDELDGKVYTGIVSKLLLNFYSIVALIFFVACKTPTIEQEKVPLVPPEKPVIVQDTVPQKNAEYVRSVEKISEGSVITQEDFVADKKEIMKNIEELGVIMKSQDYQKWLQYIMPESIKYWSNQRNLATVTLRLPVRGQTIRSFIDYFLMIFIPSRTNAEINEIRYISKNIIKAVQHKDDTDIIYYTFVQTGNKWLLQLDTLE